MPDKIRKKLLGTDLICFQLFMFLRSKSIRSSRKIQGETFSDFYTENQVAISYKLLQIAIKYDIFFLTYDKYTRSKQEDRGFLFTEGTVKERIINKYTMRRYAADVKGDCW